MQFLAKSFPEEQERLVIGVFQGRIESCPCQRHGQWRLLELTAEAGALTVTFVEALPDSMIFQKLAVSSCRVAIGRG